MGERASNAKLRPSKGEWFKAGIRLLFKARK